MSSSRRRYIYQVSATSNLTKFELHLDEDDSNKDKVIVYPSKESFTPRVFKETYNIELPDSKSLRHHHHKVLFDLEQRTAILYRRDGNPPECYIAIKDAPRSNI